MCGILLDRWDPRGDTPHRNRRQRRSRQPPPHNDVFAGPRLFTLPAADAHDLFSLLAEAAENPEETEHGEYVVRPDARGRPPCKAATIPASEGAAVPERSTAQPRQTELSTQPALRLIAYSLHATLSHLRRALRLATHDENTDITPHTGSRYELDPARVAFDVWEFAQAVPTSRGSTAEDGTREECLRRATRLYVGDFAAELTAGWIEAPREALRRDYLDAVSTLVRMGSHSDPCGLSATICEG
ncbi:BTAD domain-containing putative transcriptional regulator [Streptomyces longispororuber]|uniref:AfsR/SARP family transcriptional regulator n=1 Tax=Streptomyces longispororuber TaxID=68230 RepID=UPI0036FBF726